MGDVSIFLVPKFQEQNLITKGVDGHVVDVSLVLVP